MAESERWAARRRLGRAGRVSSHHRGGGLRRDGATIDHRERARVIGCGPQERGSRLRSAAMAVWDDLEKRVVVDHVDAMGGCVVLKPRTDDLDRFERESGFKLPDS